jgi:hypothetical protein
MIWVTLLAGALQSIVERLKQLKAGGLPLPEGDKDQVDGWLSFADGDIGKLEKSGADPAAIQNLKSMVDMAKDALESLTKDMPEAEPVEPAEPEHHAAHHAAHHETHQAPHKKGHK